MDFILEDIYSKHNTSFAPITHILDFEVYCVEGLIPLAYYVFLFSNERKSGLKEWFVLVKNWVPYNLVYVFHFIVIFYKFCKVVKKSF